ncbi:MAG: PIG-L family deacetylase [candidate division Zixibacteria bacterium]|nr:PIG-L family deacetylase [candidate division Zixibacteria bacterium]
MAEKLKLMTILAHPDDESLAMGGTLSKYQDEGVETYLVCATRGERGRFGDAAVRPSDEIVGRTREQELLAAAKELGLREVRFLNYLDKDLDQADPAEAIARIVAHIRRVRPQVVTTFAHDGAYGHPDHIAISQLTQAACIRAADSDYQPLQRESVPTTPHAVSKLYYTVWTEGKMAAYISAFRNLTITVDGVERSASPWPTWGITTIIDTAKYWPQVWRAIQHHKTQLTIYEKLEHLSDKDHQQLWGSQEFYRAYSLVNGGRKRETDLFEGIR